MGIFLGCGPSLGGWRGFCWGHVDIVRPLPSDESVLGQPQVCPGRQVSRALGAIPGIQAVL